MQELDVFGRSDGRALDAVDTPGASSSGSVWLFTAPSQEAPDGWQMLMEDWALGPDEALRLLGCGTDASDAFSGRGLQNASDRLGLLLQLHPLLMSVFGCADAVRAWLRRPNAQLAMGSPLDRMMASPEWTRWLLGCALAMT